MHPIAILLIGVVIVIGGVLFFRLHAFLALTLAALVVGLLTPTANIEKYWLDKNKVRVVGPGEEKRTVVLDLKPSGGAFIGDRYVVLRSMKEPMTESERQRFASAVFDAYNSNNNAVLEANEWKRLPQLASADTYSDDKGLTHEELSSWTPTLLPIAELEITSFFKEKVDGEEKNYAIAKQVGPLFSDELAKHDLVVSPKTIAAARKDAKKTVGERVAAAFGSTCGKIGILIALAAIIGKCLLDSGAADRIVRSALKVVGEKGAPAAFIGSGFLLGVPVFFDTVFYLMIPLGKALRMRTGRNYLLYVLTIVAGGTMAHSLVPPTPGPLFVAEELKVDLGLMIIAGCIVGLFTASAGFLWASFINRRVELPLRDSPDFSLEEIEAISKREDSELPSLFVSLLPIVLPVILIAGNTIIDSFDLVGKDSSLRPIAATLGNKNIALALATMIALAMLVRQKKTNLRSLADSIQGALASGGVIILITSGGGAFGGMLQQTGVAGLIQDLPSYSPQVIIVLAFLITTAVRTAQGSATVAMITAVGILAGFASSETLGCHPVYLALAIGCGSKPIAWMNDSGFWVICKMSGMSEAEGLRFVTPMSIIMGVVGLGITLLGVTFIPLN
jgi:GntP family gluconate:H+ symporter